MNKRDRMKADAAVRAAKLGHKLSVEWLKNRWGFYTTCENCGALASLIVSKGEYRENALDGSYKCPGKERKEEI